eukprot:scaffold7033_cov257-Pinguiococcus_pyrenoidosus.AAC.31
MGAELETTMLAEGPLLVLESAFGTSGVSLGPPRRASLNRVLCSQEPGQIVAGDRSLSRPATDRRADCHALPGHVVRAPDGRRHADFVDFVEMKRAHREESQLIKTKKKGVEKSPCASITCKVQSADRILRKDASIPHESLEIAPRKDEVCAGSCQVGVRGVLPEGLRALWRQRRPVWPSAAKCDLNPFGGKSKYACFPPLRPGNLVSSPAPPALSSRGIWLEAVPLS